jgi:exodeoxyribonuclease VII large subunit
LARLWSSGPAPTLGLPVADAFPSIAAPRVWSVGALLLAVSDALAARFGACAVQGELSGFQRASSGHCYFTLKDAQGASASVRCAMFRRAASLLDFAPRDGQQVELRGRLALYEPRGEMQFVVESMRAVGAGSLYEQFLRLKDKLQAEGLFDADRKRALPAYPQRVGVVTSLAGAALHDVLTTLARRAPHIGVIVYPSPVQGAEAPPGLLAALARAAARDEVELLIVARGGGSIEDLWAFNDERVVRAVAALPMPVLSGVGHETDVTLVDFAADLRAPTPTAAAELAAPSQDDLLSALAAQALRLAGLAARLLDAQAQRLDRAALRLARPSQALSGHAQRLLALALRHHRVPAEALRREAERLPRGAERLRAGVAARLRAHEAHLSALGGRLAALDPSRVLARGYAFVLDDAQQAVTSARSVGSGQPLALVWHDGRARVRVE